MDEKTLGKHNKIQKLEIRKLNKMCWKFFFNLKGNYKYKTQN